MGELEARTRMHVPCSADLGELSSAQGIVSQERVQTGTSAFESVSAHRVMSPEARARRSGNGDRGDSCERPSRSGSRSADKGNGTSMDLVGTSNRAIRSTRRDSRSLKAVAPRDGGSPSAWRGFPSSRPARARRTSRRCLEPGHLLLRVASRPTPWHRRPRTATYRRSRRI